MDHTLFGVERRLFLFYMRRILETFLCGWGFVMRNAVIMVRKKLGGRVTPGSLPER